MSNRKSYDTRVKYLARNGLLPERYKRQINRSLICKWKQEPKDKYVGFELHENLEELYDLMKLVADDERIRKGVKAAYRIIVVLKGLLSKNTTLISQLKKHKEEVITNVQRAGKSISIQKACRLVGISISTYRTWAKEVYFKCNNSLLKLCKNSYPHQLTYTELKKMHRMLLDRQFCLWPISSVVYYGMKHSIVKAHPNTWYKYARLMKIKRLRTYKRKKKYGEGIRTTAPNQKWHADITEIMLSNGQVAYIYLVIDNFSRYILSWRVAARICAKTRLETFREAVIKSKKRKPKELNTQIIVDGGTENNNHLVEEYVQTSTVPLDKIVALKDILKSNSMIEYTNRTLKYEYLFAQAIGSFEHLLKIMYQRIFDFNNVSPQAVLSGLTPIEAYTGIQINPDQQKDLFIRAKKARIHYNKTHSCYGCPFGCKS